tara:strand:- start:1421 stop:2140 length:720 start_codon:yes stop_codon:yes gene_type:complete
VREPPGLTVRIPVIVPPARGKWFAILVARAADTAVILELIEVIASMLTVTTALIEVIAAVLAVILVLELAILVARAADTAVILELIEVIASMLTVTTALMEVIAAVLAVILVLEFPILAARAADTVVILELIEVIAALLTEVKADTAAMSAVLGIAAPAKKIPVEAYKFVILNVGLTTAVKLVEAVETETPASVNKTVSLPVVIFVTVPGAEVKAFNAEADAVKIVPSNISLEGPFILT